MIYSSVRKYLSTIHNLRKYEAQTQGFGDVVPDRRGRSPQPKSPLFLEGKGVGGMGDVNAAK